MDCNHNFNKFQNENIRQRPKEATKLYLAAPWPVNRDGCIYGIDVFEFDAKTNEWHRRLVVEFNDNNEKYGFGCVCVDKKLYLFGGERCIEVYDRLRFDAYDDIESYDIETGHKETLPRMPNRGRSIFWSIAVGKYIYIFGGQDQEQQPINECLRFDTKLHSWRELHPMPEEYSRPIAQNNVKELNGLIYVACGRYVESFYVYDPKVDNWMQLTSPSMAIENPILFKWKNVLNVVDEGVLTRYDPTHDTWTSIKMNSGDITVFIDAIEFRGEIFTCASSSSWDKPRSFSFGKMKLEKEECTLRPIEEPPSIFRPGCLLFLS